MPEPSPCPALDLRGNPGDPSSASNIADFSTKHIELDWALDFEQHSLSGWAELTVEKAGSVGELVFDASALDIHGASLRSSSGLVPTEYAYEAEGGVLGGRLVVKVPTGATQLVVHVDYATTSGCKALQWLRPEQTAGGKHPFVFSQCQAILARTLLPCQDSPAVKATYTATVRVPRPLCAVMSANERVDYDGATVFHQTMPIPSYLIALAAGNLASKPLGEISSVWSEPELLEKAAWEFAQVQECLDAAVELCGPYRWGRYDMLILPPSFPFGGMENPCLTFLTPSLLAGDRSLVNVIAHEIAHSWTGNLVTNRSWEHFWLNEGFTTFVERKIIGRMEGEASRHLHALVGLAELESDLGDFPLSHPGRQLLPALEGVDPEDVFSVVPYEKGHTLLVVIEQLVGGPGAFEPYLRAYIKTFADGPPLDTSTWWEHLLSFFPRLSLDLDEWFKGEQMPPTLPAYDRSLMEAVECFADAWIASGCAPKHDAFTECFTSWQQMLFLDRIALSKNANIAEALDAAYTLSSTSNVEILLRWYKLAINRSYEPAYAGAARFVTQHGRMKYCRPIYRMLYANEASRQLALDTFKAHRSFYHPVAAAMIAKDLHLP